MTTPDYKLEQIHAFAPDERSLKAGKSQAAAKKWSEFGRHESAVWGLCQGSGKNPYQTQIDLSEPAFRCSCPSRKFPCKHALGLFIILATDAGKFQTTAPPPWVKEWIAKRRAREREQTEPVMPKKRVADPKAAARRAARREAKVEQGLEDLDNWMRDLIRQGLADAPNHSPDFWDNTAARLVDSQAGGLARMVEELAEIVRSDAGWQERLLEKLAQIHLLVSGYRLGEQNSPELWPDLRRLIGWADDKKELLARPGVEDSWTVLGQSISEIEVGGRMWGSAMRVQRIWMAGSNSRKLALYIHFAPPGRPLDISFHVGTCFTGTIVFYPSAFPLRALIREPRGPHAPAADIPCATTIRTATADYGAALSTMPWIGRMALALEGVVPVHHNDTWYLLDRERFALPLARSFALGWEILALSGGAPMNCCGEWDGREFLPLTVSPEDRWTDIAGLTKHDLRKDDE